MACLVRIAIFPPFVPDLDNTTHEGVRSGMWIPSLIRNYGDWANHSPNANDSIKN